MECTISLLVLTLALVFGDAVHVWNDEREADCNVCRAIVFDMNDKIGYADPNKRVKVKSARLDADWNNKFEERHYARTEEYIENLLEYICLGIINWGRVKYEDGSLSVVRVKDYGESKYNTTGYDVDIKSGKKFRYQCEEFLEDHTEAMSSLLQRENVDNYEKLICGENFGFCTEKALSRELIQLPLSEVDDDEGDLEYGPGGLREMYKDKSEL